MPAKPQSPETKKQFLTNIIQNACSDFQVPMEHIEYFTQEVTKAVRVFESSPPQDLDELKCLLQGYEIMRELVKGPLQPDEIQFYAGAVANYYLAMMAGLDDPRKYAEYLSPDEVVRRLLGAGKDNLS